MAAIEDEEPLQGRMDEEEPLQGRMEEDEPVQGQMEEEEPLQGQMEEEEPLQGRRAPAPPAQRQEAGGAPGAGGGLPPALRSGVEQLSGVAMDGVRIHRDSARPAEIGALAYAQGRDIHLGPGQERHLPHEAWHIAQQAQGRVRATTQAAGGVAVNDDPGLESEADRMGAAAQRLGARLESGRG
jgi:hypothetical protein